MFRGLLLFNTVGFFGDFLKLVHLIAWDVLFLVGTLRRVRLEIGPVKLCLFEFGVGVISLKYSRVIFSHFGLIVLY